MQRNTCGSVNTSTSIQSGKQKFVFNDSDFPALPKSDFPALLKSESVENQEIPIIANLENDTTESDCESVDSLMDNPLNDEDADCDRLSEFIAKSIIAAKEQTEAEKDRSAYHYL